MCQTANPGSLPPEIAAFCQDCPDEIGGGGGGWPELPPIPELPPPALPPPGQVPAGFVTEEQCATREALAYESGQAAAESNTVKIAAISAVVTGIAGGLTGYMLSRWA